MATETASSTPSETGTESASPLYPLSVDQFLSMVNHGIFGDDDVELIQGRLVRIMTKGEEHDFCLLALGRLLTTLETPDWYVREDKSLNAGRWSRPEPDIAIVKGPFTLKPRSIPDAHTTFLVVEVSVTTYAMDREVKGSLYASEKIPVYWIVNLLKRQVEVYTSPEGQGRTAAYGRVETFGEGTLVPVVIAGLEVGTVAVNDILP
jgi:Uma2 family endonuclease